MKNLDEIIVGVKIWYMGIIFFIFGRYGKLVMVFFFIELR